VKSVILIMADQLRADAPGYAGNVLRPTASIDRLARRGTRFLRHYTPNQICSPSRATLFSGLYPRHHGLHRNGVSLSEHMELVSHAFRREGYRTFGCGKFHFQPMEAPAHFRMPESWPFWASGMDEGWSGPFYGFQKVAMVIGESAYSVLGGHYAKWLAQADPDAARLYSPAHALTGPPADLDEVWESAVPEGLHYNRWIARQAVDFVRAAGAGKPFFLFVSFPDPHHPFTPPRPYSRFADPSLVPMPAVRTGELDRMPDYIRGGRPGEEGDSYLSLVMGRGEVREQGYMMRTDALSEATLRRLIAYTYGMVRMIDDCVGEILDAVTEGNLIDDCIVAFTSDHGEFLGDHGLLHKGPPPYRQLLQVPLVIAGSGFEARSVHALTSHLDLKPTLLEAAGIRERAAGDGVSLLPLACGTAKRVRDALFAEYHPRVAREQYNQSIILEDARFTIYPEASDWGEYFRHGADPGEHHNLYGDPRYQAETDRLRERLRSEFPPRPDIPSAPIAIY